MSHNKTNMYDIEAHVAEIYDKQEDYTNDVDLIRKLVEGKGTLKILEPFCGTGRILVPLVADGHSVVGIDAAQAMLDSARRKIEKMPAEAQGRAELFKADVLEEEWPDGFDLVILGGNCLYELATAEEQEKCISRAAASLKPDGYLFMDNEHMEGELAESWQCLDTDEAAFPSGACDDGTEVRTRRERVWFDVPGRLVGYKRVTKVTFPDGRAEETTEYEMQCHPPSTVEMRAWLEKYGCTVEKLFGDREGNPYKDDSNRAIFWARKNS